MNSKRYFICYTINMRTPALYPPLVEVSPTVILTAWPHWRARFYKMSSHS